MADNSAPSGPTPPHAHRPISNERPSPFTMSEAARALHLGTGRRIIDDLVREQRLAAEAARAMNQETARRAFEDLMREHRLRAEAARARQQEDARRAVDDLMRKHRLADEAASAPPPASAATTTSSRAMPRTPPPVTAPGVHAVSDASSLQRVRNFLVLADAAAIALNLFRLQPDTLVAELGFNDQPRTDERFGRILQGISAPLKELNLVRSAVFTSNPKTTGQSFVACLQDCYQSRGYTAERCEDPAYLAVQTFVNLRGPIGPPGVNFGGAREPDDGWNSWRTIYAADGRQLAEYGRIRTQIIGLAGIHERNIISREQCFTSHPICWPTRYTTSDLVSMAKEAHGIACDAALTCVVSPASDVFAEEATHIFPPPPASPPTEIHADNAQSLGSVKSNGAQTANKVKGKNIDARMLKITAENPLSHGWTAKEWALHLNCAESTVKESKTWKEYLNAVRAMQKVEAAERMGDKGKRRKG